MLSRRRINSFALVFAAVVTGSFALGTVMLVQRMRPSSPARDSSVPAGLNVPARLTAAASHLKQGNTEQALVAYRQILSADPRSIDAQMGLARGELSAGREEIAGQEFARVLELDPNNTAALLEVARIQSHRSKTWPAAELSYREYLKRRAEDADGWLALARVLALEKKSGEAADIFSRADVTRRMSVKDQRDFAFALVRAGRLEPAETLLKKLIAGEPKDFDLRLQLAAIYSTRYDWNDALPLYESLLSEKPYDFRLNLTYGLGLLSQKRYREALRPLERARNVMPDDGEAGLGFARALKGSGDLRKADHEFARALAHYPSNAALQREYADLLLERKDYGKSETYYKEGYSLGLRDDRLLIGLAGALSGSRKYKEAIPYLENAYQRQPTGRLAFELAKLYQKVGRNDRAMELISKIDSP